MNPENLSFLGRKLLDRRSFLSTAGLSTAGLALAGLLSADGLLADDDAKTVSGKSPIRPAVDPNNPYAARGAHFETPAKQVLVVYLPGAVSHVDTFDYKPALEKLHFQFQNIQKDTALYRCLTIRNKRGKKQLSVNIPIQHFENGLPTRFRPECGKLGLVR